MKGDSIIVEEQHRRAASDIANILSQDSALLDSRHTVSIAGESGSGKSETAKALYDELKTRGINSYIFQQDDYFIYPPKTNDKTRRQNIEWVGPGEVRLNLLDNHLNLFLKGANSVTKPLVIYDADRIDEEVADLSAAMVAIAEGTYTSLLKQARSRVFIDRNYLDTRAHREKRKRDASELDEFIERVLTIEHEIIASHKSRASIIVDRNYSAYSSD